MFLCTPPEGGTEIGFIVATDFTASNGDPNSPDSKHFFSGELRRLCPTVRIGECTPFYTHTGMLHATPLACECERECERLGSAVVAVLLLKRPYGSFPLLTHAAGTTQYEKAIMGIGQVIEHYDADKIFPMYGFGGSYQRGPANHCFPMGPHPDGTCHGVSGLLQAYRWAGLWCSRRTTAHLHWRCSGTA